MEMQDVPLHPVDPWMFPAAQELRRNAPGNLVSLIEGGVLGDVTSLKDLTTSQVSVLPGGENSVCYLLENNGKPAVIKFRHAGSEAETQALLAWGERGLLVPAVLSYGIVPGTESQEKPVKYLMEEAVVDDNGELSQVGHKFIVKNPEARRPIFARLGTILAGIHGVQAPAELGFGGLADTWGSGSGYDSFGDYLSENVEFYRETLIREGFDPDQINLIIAAMKGIQFPDRAVFAHGDYGPHNALVRNGNPEDLVVFDPNPLLADPYWDIGPMLNYLEIKKLKAEANPENQAYQSEYDIARQDTELFLSAYKSETGQDFGNGRMDAIRFVRLLRKIDYDSRKEDHSTEPKNFSKAKIQRILIELDFSRKIMKDLGAKLASSRSAQA